MDGELGRSWIVVLIRGIKMRAGMTAIFWSAMGVSMQSHQAAS